MPRARWSYFILQLMYLSHTALATPINPPFPPLGSLASTRTASTLNTSTRVSPKYYSKTDCISSKTQPIIETPATTCPCFIRYIIGSDDPTTWDIFLIPQAAYDVWKSQDYKDDPSDIVEEYSTRQLSTEGTDSFIRTPDVNAFITGEYHLVVRTNTDELRCFNDASTNGISSQIVFESMPKACELKSEEVEPKIVGGTAVNKDNTPDEMKYMALISTEAGPVCGGVHIDDGYVLTAAHCEIGARPQGYNVRLGILQTDEGKAYPISRVFTHPEYHQLASREALYDIAILELGKRDGSKKKDVIPWNDDAAIPAAGEIVTTAGFGYISEGWEARPEPNRLLRVDVPVVSRRRCEGKFENVDGDLHVCAGYEEGGCDSCQSDSGGPLRYVERFENGSRRQVVVGIVSFGSGCARSENPGVYTRVSTFAGWINETLVYARGTRKEGGFWTSLGGVAVIVAVVLVGGGGGGWRWVCRLEEEGGEWNGGGGGGE